jgi:hypothetical protein
MVAKSVLSFKNLLNFSEELIINSLKNQMGQC